MNVKPNRTTAAIAEAFPSGTFIYAFDRVTLWLDHSDLPIKERILKMHCTELRVIHKPMKFNTLWKLKLEIHQPTATFLQLLAGALASHIGVLITKVEIACDSPAASRQQTNSWLQQFLASAHMNYQRQVVKKDRAIWYFGRRTKEADGIGQAGTDGAWDDCSGDGGNEAANCWDTRGNVTAAYADRPSKLNNSRPTKSDPPCLHIEWRANGSNSLARLGIVSLKDLMRFDHQQFWNTHVTLYQLPRRTDLGRLLAKFAVADSKVSGTALRKRATKWISNNSIKGTFVMHNALLATKGISRHLSAEPFMDWLKKLVISDQG